MEKTVWDIILTKGHKATVLLTLNKNIASNVSIHDCLSATNLVMAATSHDCAKLFNAYSSNQAPRVDTAVDVQ